MKNKQFMGIYIKDRKVKKVAVHNELRDGIRANCLRYN
jgi:hypothetical protein